MISSQKKKRIHLLRRQGHSIPEISLLCKVSKSTVFRHVLGVEIDPKFRARLQGRRQTSRIRSEKAWKVAEVNARGKFQSVSQKDLSLIAAYLYWAEGAKRDFSFCNTDPKMVRTFVYALRNAYGVKNEDLMISLRLYEDLDKAACLKFWSEITGVRLNKLTKIDVLNGKKKGKLVYGMCRIRVRNGSWLLKDFVSITQRIQQLLN